MFQTVEEIKKQNNNHQKEKKKNKIKGKETNTTK